MITQEEVKKLARASRLSIEEHELPEVTKRVAEVIEYVQMLDAIHAQFDVQNMNTLSDMHNVMRKDSPLPSCPAPLLAQGPEVEHALFVVPSIIKQ